MNKIMNMLVLVLMLAGCAKQVEEVTIRGQDGKDGISMAIAMEPSAPSCGTAGGITVKTFVDLNYDTNLDSNEPVKQTSVICNGRDGINGTNATLTVTQATSTQCPTGGYVLTSSDSSTPAVICNGAKGDTGPQGPIGQMGGIGNITPVQLCPGDNGTYKEYGLVVGTALYAVYHDNAAGNTFLALLKPGTYVTTNGGGCVFSYANNGTTATLSNGSGTTTINLTSSSSGGSSNTLAGSCSVVKFADYQSEQQFHFAVTGMASYSSYTLEITFNNDGVVNQVQDSNGGASSYVNPLYTIAPQNLANGFDFYAKHNGNVTNKPTVASAKVKKNGQEMTCTVQN